MHFNPIREPWLARISETFYGLGSHPDKDSRIARGFLMTPFNDHFKVFILLGGAFDPFPYIFLNLALSTLASVQAPIIMMSQNRQTEKDRITQANAFEVNLKIELGIQQLHEKIDKLSTDKLSTKD